MSSGNSTGNNFKLSNRYTTHLHTVLGENRAKGGVLISVKTNISHKRLPIRTNLQAVAIEVENLEIRSLISIYLPPNQPVTEQELSELISQLPQPLLLVGDLNAHNRLWYGKRTDPRGELIERILEKYNLTCLNDKSPTYYNINNQTSSNIDLSIISTNKSLTYAWETLPYLHGSDHYPITLTSILRQTTENLPRWNLELADWAKFTKETEIFMKIGDFSNIEDAYEHLVETINKAATKCIPLKKLNLNRPPVPWWNNDCYKEKKITRSAFRKMKNNPTVSNIITYKRRSAIKRKVYKNARKQSWIKYISTLTSRTPTKQVWHKLKKIEGKFNPKPQPILQKDGQIIKDPVEVANVFASYYATISTAKNKTVKNKTRANTRRIEEYNHPLTMKELSAALLDIKDNKAPGEDKVQNIMLKNLPNRSLKFMLDLFNKIWQEGIIPTQWKTSIIIPILKDGKPKNETSSYRPVALSSSICKLMEKIINARLLWYLEKFQKISPQQFGFRPKRSTIEPISQLTTEVLNGFTRKRNTIAVLFDIEKAFDTIDTNKVLANLNNMGINGHMLTFIDNYISERTIKVRIGNTYSKTEKLETGTPQGGVLSPTCFIAAINGILETLPHNVQGSLYADDLIIYCTTGKLNTAIRQLQIATNNIINWANKQGLHFSPFKTKAILFERRKKQRDIIPNIKMNDCNIRFEDSVKFLGMTIDKKLNWTEHIKNLKAKAQRSLNILRAISRLRYGPDKQTLLRLYWAICRSKLEYGAQIYSSARPNVLKLLDPVHNEAMRLCSGAFRSSPASSLLTIMQEVPLALHREEQCLRYLYKLKSNESYNTTNIMNPSFDIEYFINERIPKPVGVRCRELDQNNETKGTPIQPEPMKIPSWIAKEINVCFEGSKTTKNAVPTAQIRQEFISHLYKHIATSYCFTDGSKTDERVGFAAVFGLKTIKGSLPREASVFTAELKAIEAALQEIKQQRDEFWTIFVDSQSALQAIK